ncbi:hypothetical protein B0H34DRAFT_850885 [Crassisporium funariophilum]|nr:hypothetical protein B0H34DRAFT_850885 [Crassisporium funariophilum]
MSGQQPIDNHGQPINLLDADMARIQDVIGCAWEESTHEMYGSGLLAFHVYCDSRNIPDTQQAPASPVLILAFLACLAGAYSSKTLHNYLHAVCAWHILYGIPWVMNKDEMATVMKAVEKLTPEESKRKKRRPYTPDFIIAIRNKLNLETPPDAAVYACLVTCFYAAVRLGKFTVWRLNDFDPTKHITPANLSSTTDRHGNKLTVLHLPRTKICFDGEDVYWAKQDGLTDPVDALNHHRHINMPASNSHLFAYKFKSGHRPLTKDKFLKRIAVAACKAGLEPLQGHGIRIGATLEYLLRGVSFEVIGQATLFSSI